MAPVWVYWVPQENTLIGLLTGRGGGGGRGAIGDSTRQTSSLQWTILNN